MSGDCGCGLKEPSPHVSPRCLDIVEPQHREFEPIQVESASVAAADEHGVTPAMEAAKVDAPDAELNATPREDLL